jgi:LysR substrate binding domain
LVDLIREGFDCVLRVGDLQDSDLIARRVGMLAEITCAAPAYIERFGMPTDVGALANHRMVGFHSGRRRLAQCTSAGHGGGERSGKSCRCGETWSGADPGATLSRRKRSGARNTRSRPRRLSAVANTGLAALSPEPATVTARARVHRLARPPVRSGSRLILVDDFHGFVQISRLAKSAPPDSIDLPPCRIRHAHRAKCPSKRDFGKHRMSRCHVKEYARQYCA